MVLKIMSAGNILGSACKLSEAASEGGYLWSPHSGLGHKDGAKSVHHRNVRMVEEGTHKLPSVASTAVAIQPGTPFES